MSEPQKPTVEEGKCPNYNRDSIQLCIYIKVGCNLWHHDVDALKAAKYREFRYDIKKGNLSFLHNFNTARYDVNVVLKDAIELESYEAIEILSRYKPNFTSALCHASSRKMIECLTKLGADTRNSLYFAKSVEHAELLFAFHADPNAIVYTERTQLVPNVPYQTIKIIEKRTPLMNHIQNYDMVVYLLSIGANPHVVDENGKHLIQYALEVYNSNVLPTIIDRLSDKDMRKYLTSLLLIHKKGFSIETLRLFHKFGADLFVLCENNEPFLLNYFKENPYRYLDIRQFGLTPEYKFNNGTTVVECLLQSKAVKIVRILLEEGIRLTDQQLKQQKENEDKLKESKIQANIQRQVDALGTFRANTSISRLPNIHKE